MEQEQLERFRTWFDDYVAGFYGDDEKTNANLKLKEDHSRRTCNEMLYLADELGLIDIQRRTAEVIALFHDIGRFEQFIRYQTYNDAMSVNHSLLGVDVLRQERALDGIKDDEKQIIERAIEYHGLKELPADLDGDYSLFSKLIRDADKLDIFYMAIDWYRLHGDNAEEITMPLDFPDEPRCSPEVVEDILNCRRTNYNELKTLNDMKIMQLGWVYDVNFMATLKRIKQRKFLEDIIDFLPKTEDIERVKKKIFEYVDSAIKKSEG